MWINFIFVTFEKNEMKKYFMTKGFTLFVVLIVGLSITSCFPREKIVYFQSNLESIEQMAGEYSAVIQPDDLLSITVFGRSPESTVMFNQSSNITLSGGSTNKDMLQTYLVDSEGYIEYPVFGRVKLGGMTRNQAIQYMKGLLSKEIIDPGVSINITNFRITVLGEVNRPGTFPIDNEKITVLEALGKAGDLTINGVRENILVIREENDKRNFYRVNLLSDEIFTSPVYYLSQNDIIYVEPNKNKINAAAEERANFPLIISATSIMLAIITLIIR